MTKHIHKKSKNQNNSRGLTLIEVLFAVGLLAIIIAALGSVFQSSSALTVSARTRLTATQDAERVLEEARRLADAVGLTGAGSVSDATYWTAWIAGQGFTSLPSESVAVSFPAGTGNDPLEVKVQINWLDKGSTKSFDMSCLLTRHL